jgi:hypothetical protein
MQRLVERLKPQNTDERAKKGTEGEGGQREEMRRVESKWAEKEDTSDEHYMCGA